MIRHYRRDELENQLNRQALWAITYGDLMSYLMIFFLILFSFSLTRAHRAEGEKKYEQTLGNIQKVFGGQAPPGAEPAGTQGAKPEAAQPTAREREENLAQQLAQSIKAQQLTKYATVAVSEEKVRLVLKEPVLFDSGFADLKPMALPILKEIAEALKSLPNEIVVEGHTDNVPIHHGRYGSNWELSMARAYQVVQFLENSGIDPKRLSGEGYGEHRPIADNKTSEGRAQNRRIDITLIRAR